MSKQVAYDRPIEGGALMTVEEFKSDCDAGALIDYDGFGYPVKDGKSAGYQHKVYPSERHSIPADATHIVWFNR